MYRDHTAGIHCGIPGMWPAPYLSGVHFLAWDWGWDQETGTWLPYTECSWARQNCQVRVDRVGSSPACLLGCAGWFQTLEFHCRHPAGATLSQPKHSEIFTNRKTSFLQQLLSFGHPLCMKKVLFILHCCWNEKKSINKTNKNMGILKKNQQTEGLP